MTPLAMSADEARAILVASVAAIEANKLAQVQLLESVAAEALPAIQAAWEGSTSRVVKGGGKERLRVSYVYREREKGTWDEIWLERAAYKPFDDDPMTFYLIGETYVLGEPPKDDYYQGTESQK